MVEMVKIALSSTMKKVMSLNIGSGRRQCCYSEHPWIRAEGR